MLPLTYEQTFCVNGFECDPWDRMSPGAVLRRVQEIGMDQTLALGWTENFYRDNHFVFLLSKVSLETVCMPIVGQTVRIEARGYGVYRSVFHRVISLHDEAGQKLCEADHRWLLVDTDTFKVIRHLPPALAQTVEEAPPGEEHDMTLPKPERPLFRFGEEVATVTRCDSNGHMNNTHYADLLCDHLPLERMAQGPPRKLVLDFRREIKLGHTFTLSGGPVGETGYYFTGQEADKTHFEGYAAF